MSEKPNFRLDNILADNGQGLGALEPKILASMSIRQNRATLDEDRTFCLTKSNCHCDSVCYDVRSECGSECKSYNPCKADCSCNYDCPCLSDIPCGSL